MEMEVSRVFDPGQALKPMDTDSRLHVRFYTRARLNEAKSKEMSRPFFDDIPHVIIRQPGERDEYNQPATQEDARRFPKHWQAYLDGKELEQSGTPLAVLFPEQPSVVENLRHLKISTVEQLAGLNDTQKQNIGMGGVLLVNKAKEFLAAADKGKNFHAVAAKLELLENKMQTLQDRNEMLEAAMRDKGEEIPLVPVSAPRVKRKYTRKVQPQEG